jgi:glycosyltransferase involved in cell wall biosynthesis
MTARGTEGKCRNEKGALDFPNMKSETELPTCDVVIPARNAERYIVDAIQSILCQSHEASQILVVNDRSTDGTASVAAACGSRVRILEGEGSGAGIARNLGVRHSTSELVAFLDADDVCHPDRLKLQAEALLNEPQAGMVFCDAEYTDASGRPTGSLFTFPEYRKEAFLGQLFERNRILTTSVVVVRRPAFNAVGGFDKNLLHAEDYDLWLRLAQSSRVEHVPRPLVYYRMHDSNLSSNREAHRLCEIETLKKHTLKDIHAAFLATYGNAAKADLELSRVLFRMERYDEGESLLRGVSAEGADLALRHFMLGNFAVKRGNHDTAAENYLQCLQCDPGFAPAHNNLGVIAAAEGRYQQSLEHFTRAMELRPGYADPRRNIEALQQGKFPDLCYTLAPLRTVLRPE